LKLLNCSWGLVWYAKEALVTTFPPLHTFGFTFARTLSNSWAGEVNQATHRWGRSDLLPWPIVPN
jgi:hypothetical protein